jgi:hypothetical protein
MLLLSHTHPLSSRSQLPDARPIGGGGRAQALAAPSLLKPRPTPPPRNVDMDLHVLELQVVAWPINAEADPHQ